MHLLNADTLIEPSQPVQHQGAVHDIRFSADSTLLAIASNDGSVSIWEIPDDVTSVPLWDAGEQTELAFSPNATHVGVGFRDGSAQVWDTATRHLIGDIPGGGGRVRSLAFAPDGHLLALSTGDRLLRIWDMHALRDIGTLRCDIQPYGLQFTADSQYVLSRWPAVHGWRIESGRLDPVPFTPIRGLVNTYDMDISPNLPLVATAHYSNRALIHDFRDGSRFGPALQHARAVQAVSFSDDGRLLATGSRDTTVRLWEAATGQPVGPKLPHPGRIDRVEFSNDGSMLACATPNAVHLWDVATASALGPGFAYHGSTPNLHFSEDDMFLALSNVRKGNPTLSVWSTETLQPYMPDLVGYSGAFASIEGTSSLVTAANGSIELFELSQGTLDLADAARETYREIGITLDDAGTVRPLSWDAYRDLGDASTRRAIGPIDGLAATADGTLLAATTRGLLRLVGGATQWEQTEIRTPLIRTLNAAEDSVYVGTTYGGLQRSASAGRSWLAPTELGENLRAHSGPSGELYVLTPMEGSSQIHRSAKADHVWQADESLVGTASPTAIVRHEEAVYIASKDHGVFTASKGHVASECLLAAVPTTGGASAAAEHDSIYEITGVTEAEFASVEHGPTVGATLTGTVGWDWHVAASQRSGGVFDIERLIPPDQPNPSAAAYLFTYITANRAGPARLAFYTSHAAAAWCNGEEILRVTEPASSSAPRWRTTFATLNQGVNAVMMKTISDNNTWPGGIYVGADGDLGTQVTTDPQGDTAAGLEGAKWLTAHPGLPSMPVPCLASYRASLYAGTNGSGVYRLHGDRWVEAGDELIGRHVRGFCVTNGMLYAATEVGIHRLSEPDGGWATVAEGIADRHISAIAASQRTLYAGTWDGVFRSADRGESWTPMPRTISP